MKFRTLRRLLLAACLGFLLLVIVSPSSPLRARDEEPADGGPPVLLRHPYLQKGTSRSMGVAWMIDDERPCSVEFGLTRELGQVVESPKPRRMHFVEIKNLTPDTRY